MDAQDEYRAEHGLRGDDTACTCSSIAGDGSAPLDSTGCPIHGGTTRSGQIRRDPYTTTVNGIVVYLNPLPTDYKDRLVWAFFNAGAIGANRASRGEEELDSLAAELKIERKDLKGYLRGILDTEARIAEAILDDDLNKLNHMLFDPAAPEDALQIQSGLEILPSGQ